jgi:hypothetical protein
VKKPLIVIALGIAAVATLAGCSAPAPAPAGTVEQDGAEVWTNSVDTSVGAVDCVFYDGTESAAVQCDWANLGKATATVALNEGEGRVGVVKQKVSGHRVDCVTYDSTKSGGLSCNLPSVQK